MTEEAPKRRGRKPNPLTAVISDFERAKTRLARAEKKAETAAAVAAELEAAKTGYTEAKSALDAAYESVTS